MINHYKGVFIANKTLSKEKSLQKINDSSIRRSSSFIVPLEEQLSTFDHNSKSEIDPKQVVISTEDKNIQVTEIVDTKVYEDKSNMQPPTLSKTNEKEIIKFESNMNKEIEKTNKRIPTFDKECGTIIEENQAIDENLMRNEEQKKIKIDSS